MRTRSADDNPYYGFRQVYVMSKLLYSGIFLILCLVLATGCVSQPAQPQAQQTTQTLVTPTVTIPISDANATQQAFLAIPQASLNESERQDILYLQESEKLEHDLYAKFAQQYTSIPVFASLEQASAIFVKADDIILQRYGIPNPEKPALGSFTSPKLQNLYTGWVNDGSTSAISALKAAATSEDMHIADLNAAIGRTDNNDLIFIYRQELAFSRNNLRALSQWMTAFGATYIPTYITPSYYNALINSPAEPVPLT
jgi:hypothetical protein